MRHHPAEEVCLEEGGETLQVPLGALLSARPDPLAHVEGAILAHVDTAHPDASGLLARLLQPELLQGVVRVRPWRLDQHGMVLRLTYARGSRDVRLYISGTATEPDALDAAMRSLLNRAQSASRLPAARGLNAVAKVSESRQTRRHSEGTVATHARRAGGRPTVYARGRPAQSHARHGGRHRTGAGSPAARPRRDSAEGSQLGPIDAVTLPQCTGPGRLEMQS